MKLNRDLILRHGDLIIKTVSDLPQSLKKRKSLIILYGEVSTHAHRLSNGEIFDGENDLVFLNLTKSAKLSHEEHATINLPAGKYAVLRTREWDYSSKSSRLVVD